jgi:hypothetical protein
LSPLSRLACVVNPISISRTGDSANVDVFRVHYGGAPRLRYRVVQHFAILQAHVRGYGGENDPAGRRIC